MFFTFSEHKNYIISLYVLIYYSKTYYSLKDLTSKSLCLSLSFSFPFPLAISSTDVFKAAISPLNFSNAASDLELLGFGPHLLLIKSLGLLEDISENVCKNKNTVISLSLQGQISGLKRSNN